MNNHLGHLFFLKNVVFPKNVDPPVYMEKRQRPLRKRRSSSVPLKTSIREYIDSQRFKIPCNTLPVHINHCKSELWKKNLYAFIY